MLEVHLDPATINSRKVLAGLELLGVPYKINHVNYFAGGHKQPPYTDLNPNGVLPAAKDGDFTLWESDAILQYAADMSGTDKYYPKDLKKRVDINRWLLWEAAHWQPSCYVFFIENAIKPLLKEPTDQALLVAAAGRCARRAAGKIEMDRRQYRDHRRHRGRGADACACEATPAAQRFSQHPALDCGGGKTAVLAEDTRPGRRGDDAALNRRDT